MTAELVVQSRPRLVDPDLEARIRRAPGAVWLSVVIVLAIAAVYGYRNPPFGIAELFFAVFFAIIAATAAAKMINARIVIDADSVMSRDALRRTTRCNRSELVAWRIVPSEILGPRIRRVQLLDRDGRARISFAYDSYSDQQLDQIRLALGLPHLTT